MKNENEGRQYSLAFLIAVKLYMKKANSIEECQKFVDVLIASIAGEQ